MATLNLISNNPFRILGVYVNSKVKDIVANSNKAKAYAQVNKTVSFPSDFDKWLTPIERSITNINTATSNISQTNDKIKFAFFWFANANSLDDIALEHLSKGNVEKAKDIFSKKQTYSSLLNVGIISLIEGDYKAAINNYSILIHEYHFRKDFIDAVCGNQGRYTEDELVELFYETLFEVLSASEVLRDISENHQDYETIRQKAISHPISIINSELSVSKNADRSAVSQLLAGTQLMENTKQALHTLKEIIGKEEQYQLVADGIAKQILQCSINYYNNSDDFNSARKAYVLQRYAYSIAVGQRTKERCKDNVEILQETIEALPPEELQTEVQIIYTKLSAFRKQQRSIANAIDLIKDCSPYLAAIKAHQGSNGSYYRRISTQVEEMALGCTINVVNSSLKKFEDGDNFEKYMAIASLKSTLKEAWKATLYMGVLEIEEEAKKRYMAQRQSLKSILSQVDISTSDIPFSFKLETEQELFDACKTKADYKDYIARFPKGKFTAAAKRKIHKIELEEVAEMRQLLAAITAAKSFSEAIALYAKVKDTTTKYKLDDKCFELCTSTSHYRKYLQTFGNQALHTTEANKHIKDTSTKQRIGCAVIMIMIIIISILFIKSYVKQQEDAAFRELQNNPSTEGCATFLSLHSMSVHREEVFRIYYYCADNDGVLSLNELAEDYPNSEWGQKAAEKVQLLCDSLYQVADKINTIEAWKAFQDSVPVSYYSNSYDKIERIEKKAWSTDAKAWSQARKENTLSAYEKYLELYPNGTHRRAADKKVIDMQVASVYAGAHGELPPMEQTGYGSGIYSRVTIDNSTSYTLTLLYSGPDSKRLVIAPNQSSSLSLKNGTYLIAASVNASSVRNYAGSETLRGGNYSATYYISTSIY